MKLDHSVSNALSKGHMLRIVSILASLAALTVTAPLQAQNSDSAEKVESRSTTVHHESRTKSSDEVSEKTHHPKGATAKCTDGTYSMSESATGSCSGHGGVAKWYAKARCNDGTLWMHSSKRGACSGHQGVAEWIKNNKSTTEDKR